MLKSALFEIEGKAPLICHNARLSDPLDKWTIAVAEISSKRKKTIADHMEMAHREFLGSLYLGENGTPVIPGGNIERMLRDAAAKSKRGKDIQAGVLVTDEIPIVYDGPKDPEKLWQDEKFRFRASCKVGTSRVMRTRPWFPEWSLAFEVLYDDTLLNQTAIEEFVELAGSIIGLGDWRPKHGRFEVLR